MRAANNVITPKLNTYQHFLHQFALFAEIEKTIIDVKKLISSAKGVQINHMNP